MSVDPEMTQWQREWLDRYQLAPRWIIVRDLGGYSVHVHTIDGIAPMSMYATAEQAAARVLQLLDISSPVTPQNWPEAVGISMIIDPDRRTE